jgi:GrpB-like predicted nucleotidyltransferase (UPF0157 family)
VVQLRRTNVHAWTEDWGILYQQEEEKLKTVFKDELIDIFHIGSTSIPAIGYAKPIIDILVVVKDIEKVDRYNAEMEKLGYEPRGENGIIGRRYFPKGKNNRTHHLHIFQAGSEQIKSHLDFKEYLIEHPNEAKKYGKLKISLAKQFPNDHYKYQNGKQQFVANLSGKAKEWASKN